MSLLLTILSLTCLCSTLLFLHWNRRRIDQHMRKIVVDLCETISAESRRDQNWFTALVGSVGTSLAVYTVDSTGREFALLICNEAFADLFGIQIPRSFGETSAQIGLAPDVHAALDLEISKVYRDSKSRVVDFPVGSKNRRFVLSPFRRPDGTLTGVVLVQVSCINPVNCPYLCRSES